MGDVSVDGADCVAVSFGRLRRTLSMCAGYGDAYLVLTFELRES